MRRELHRGLRRELFGKLYGKLHRGVRRQLFGKLHHVLWHDLCWLLRRMHRLLHGVLLRCVPGDLQGNLPGHLHGRLRPVLPSAGLLTLDGGRR